MQLRRRRTLLAPQNQSEQKQARIQVSMYCSITASFSRRKQTASHRQASWLVMRFRRSTCSRRFCLQRKRKTQNSIKQHNKDVEWWKSNWKLENWPNRSLYLRSTPVHPRVGGQSGFSSSWTQNCDIKSKSDPYIMLGDTINTAENCFLFSEEIETQANWEN